ncbi:MAG TPA: BTAD domain-containing putative transcriptional regulator [Casimicrobiaceae bacterium]|nr:BTAD domain-containing putative transcriptional regulator [Casimicrobiaceae bacterium]
MRADRSATAFAKTTRPTVGAAVEREALFARLDEPRGRTVIWIWGPAGSGKTTLAAGYLQARRRRSVWYQFDTDDSDPATFFHYLAHAVRRLDAAKAQALPAFTAQHREDVASFSRNFFRALFANCTEGLTLALDNLHEVSPDSELHAALEAAFSQIPKGCCAIVTSRSEPPAALARLRAASRVTCVSGNDLRLGPDEIAAMACLRGQTISPDAAAKLHQKTQGWAAALVLMLEHSKFSGRIAELPDLATPQVVFDYLAGEIFERFEPHTRAFLLRISCLRRMSASVASALANEPKAERLLVNLARNDYFVREVPADSGRMYQLHPLLRQFLLQRAIEVLPDAVSDSWRERAASILRHAGQVEDAVALLVEARNWHQVAAIAVEEGDDLLAQGRSETLAAWLEPLPPALIETDPRLLWASAASRARASPRAARRLFERAYGGFKTHGDAAGMLRSCTGVVDTLVFEFDDLTPVDRWLEWLDAGLAQRSAGPLTAETDTMSSTLIAATLLRDPGNARVRAWLGRFAQVGDERPTSAVASVELVRALAALARGELSTADAALEALRGDDARGSADTVLQGAVIESLLRLIGGRYDDATRIAQEAVARGEADGLHGYDAFLLAIFAAAKLCRGDCAAARTVLQRLAAPDSRLRRGDRALLHYLRAWLAAIEGEAADAHREAKLALTVAVETGIPWLECLARIAVAHCHADTDRRSAEARLRDAGAIAERSCSPWLGYAVRLSLADAANRTQNRRAALDEIGTAFREGHEHGFGQPLGWRPQRLAELCALALSEDVEPDFARSLVRDGNLAPAAPPLNVRRWPWRFRVVTFGGFRCLRGEQPIELSAKGPGRPMELLKVLVALGGHHVRAEALADALWPTAEADYAHNSFTATLHRLRRMLGDDDALILRDGRLTLNQAAVWIDCWALDRLFDQFDIALRGAETCDDEAARRGFCDEAFALYRGPFLAGEAEQPAYIACRERVRARLLRFLSRVAEGWERTAAVRTAADCYLRFAEVDDTCEPLYRQAMLCLQRAGAPEDAAAVYERLRTVLASRLRSMPSPETQSLYAGLRAGRPAAAG